MVVVEDLEPMIQQLDPLQSPHLLEELPGNMLVAEMLILHQLKLMELCGVGVLIVLVDLETVIQLIQIPQ